MVRRKGLSKEISTRKIRKGREYEINGDALIPMKVLDVPKERGMEDYLFLPDTTLMSFSAGGVSPLWRDFTVSFWMNYDGRTEKVYTIGPFQMGKFFSLGKKTGFYIGYKSLEIERGVYPTFVCFNLSLIGKHVLLPGYWYNIAVTFNREEDTVVLYVDGRESASSKIGDKIPKEIIPDTSYTIGHGGDGVSFYGSLGFRLKDLRLFSYAIPKDRILAFDGQGMIEVFPFNSSLESSMNDVKFHFNVESSKIGFIEDDFSYSRFNTGIGFVARDKNELQLFYALKDISLRTGIFDTEEILPVSSKLVVESLGAWKAGYALGLLHGGSNIFEMLHKLVNVPSETLTWNQVYKEGNFYIPVQPDLATVLAYFYGDTSAWNPYQNKDFVGYRAVVNALVDTLYISNTIFGPSFYNFKKDGFNLDYILFVIQKTAILIQKDAALSELVCDWISLITRVFRTFWSMSNPSNYLNIGDAETDMDLSALCALNRLFYVSRLFKLEIPNDLVIMRDEWTKLLVDMKEKAEFQISGGGKGFKKSGVGLTDGTINSSYMGLMYDRLAELYNLSNVLGDEDYKKRVENTLIQVSKLRNGLQGLWWNPDRNKNMRISGNGFDNRTSTPHSFSSWQSHGSEASVLDSQELSGHTLPFLFQDFERDYKDVNALELLIERRIRDTFKSAYTFPSYELGQQRSSMLMAHKWGNFNPISVFENYKNHVYESKPENKGFAIEDSGNSIRTFGNTKRTDFIVGKTPNLYLVLSSFENPGKTNYRGWRGCGINSLSLKSKDGKWFTPILSRYTNNSKRKVNPTVDVDTNYAITPGWKEFPNNHLIGMGTDGLVYSSCLYESFDPVIRYSDQIETSSPFYVWDDASIFASMPPSKGSGIEQRLFTFSNDSLNVKILLSSLPPNLKGCPVYEVLPIFSFKLGVDIKVSSNTIDLVYKTGDIVRIKILSMGSNILMDSLVYDHFSDRQKFMTKNALVSLDPTNDDCLHLEYSISLL